MSKLTRVMAAVIVCMAPVLAHADKLADIKSKGVLRVAVTVDAAPWGYTDAQGKPTGLDVELAEALAKNMDVKLELQQVTGANRIPYLLSNKVDVLVAALGSSPERAKQVAFSSPYAATVLGVYGGPDIAKVAAPKDLAQYTIAVPKGSTPDLSLSELSPGGKYLRLEDTASTISAFLSGQAPLFAENNFIALKVQQENPAKKVELKTQIRVSPAYMAVSPKETALLGELNKFIEAERVSGNLAKLRLKWFGDEQKDLK